VSPVSCRGRERGCSSLFRPVLLSSAASLALALAPPDADAQTAPAPAPAQVAQNQNQGTLPQVQIEARKKPQARAKRAAGRTTTVGAPASVSAGPSSGQALPGLAPGAPTPLNTNLVAASATRLGLTVFQTPATVTVVSQQTMQELGYRTTTEAAQGAVGVLAGDSAAAPSSYSMRGFSGPQVNVLYNGIWTGPSDITTRWMDTAALAQVEFLQGPSSLMSGMNAIGGAVNYVNRQPTTGAIRNEVDLSLDSYGSPRTHFGSGGSAAANIDYRFDAIADRFNSFIDGDFRNLAGLATQWNWRATDTFKTFAAVEYKKDSGHAYWGTPVVPLSFAGSHAVSGVVSGTAVSTFDGSIIGPVTIDQRTRSTNYNVADNATGSQDTWLRSGFEWTPLANVTVKDQAYYYTAKRNWLDSETYAFDNATAMIDRDRFAVSHFQHIVGNNFDASADTRVFGLENRASLYLQASSNKITFKQMDDGGFPQDSVNVVGPDPGLYGPIDFDTRNSRLDDYAAAFEDRLKLTSAFALIGGVRVDDLRLARDGINSDGTIPTGQPFTKTWTPVSYRAAYTYEPIPNLMFYSMTATGYNPAVASVFSISPGNALQLTSSRLYETGAKQLLWDGRAEWTVAAYDIVLRNVFVPISTTADDVAGEVKSRGIEVAAAVRPFDGWKLWGNFAYNHTRFASFDAWTGNTPPNVPPVIANAGASYRFAGWRRWPVEIGGTVRYVGDRYLFQDNLTTLDAYTTGDVYASVDIPGRDLGSPMLDNLRLTFRVRNVTDRVYAAWADSTYPDQVLLGAPRTYEVAASARW
jgi:iron complex outermembrane recepter protein